MKSKQVRAWAKHKWDKQQKHDKSNTKHKTQKTNMQHKRKTRKNMMKQV